MSENSNNNIYAFTDLGIVGLIGNFIKKQRINQQKTQQQLAKAAGVHRFTIGQIENGEPISLMSLIQIMRALDQLYFFEHFDKNEPISPIQMAKIQKKQRQRVRNPFDNNKKSNW